MTERYKSPVPADPDYIFALGQAMYSFSSLEGMVVWMAERMSPGFIYTDHDSMMAGKIAVQFRKFVKASKSRVDEDTWSRLDACSVGLFEAVDLRKDLLHARPYTEEGGVQQLIRRQSSGDLYKLDIDRIDAATRFFDELNVELSDLFHNKLFDPALLKELNDNVAADTERS